VSMRTFDPEPGMAPERRFVVASAETLAFAVASGQVGDPRSFKRPVRVTVPRSLPTDDVLIVRKSKSKARGDSETGKTLLNEPALLHGWKKSATLALVSERSEPSEPSALVLSSLDDVRWAATRAADLAANLRAVIAPHIPSGTVPIFAGSGILALTADLESIKKLKGQSSVGVAPPERWDAQSSITVTAGAQKLDVEWRAVGPEREWTASGTARSAQIPGKPAR